MTYINMLENTYRHDQQHGKEYKR